MTRDRRSPPIAPEGLPRIRQSIVGRVNRFLAARPALYLRVLRRFRPADAERFAYVALLRRGDVVIDVGANQGLFTVLFSNLVGPTGAVHAFEPVERTFGQLTAAVERFARDDNVRLNRAACSDASGGIDLHVPGDDSGQASLVRHRTGSWATATSARIERAPAITLDRYAREAGLDRVDLIKCDVEGAELKVLQGAEACLRQHHPLLALEVLPEWTRDFGYDPSDVIRVLRSLAYDRFVLVGAGAVRLIDPDASHPGTYPVGAMLVCGQLGRHDDRFQGYFRWRRPSETTPAKQVR